MLDLIEIKDGLLSTPDKVMLKARCPELFPENVKEYFKDKTKMKQLIQEEKFNRVILISKNRSAVFDLELFTYIRKHGELDCYISNVPLPGENIELYPLFARYEFGWICLAPLEA